MEHMQKTIGRFLSCFLIVSSLVALGGINSLSHNVSDNAMNKLVAHEQKLNAVAGYIDNYNGTLSISPEGWPMFHYNLAHIGYTFKSSAPSTNTIRWTYTTNGEIWSSPAVVDDKVYIYSDLNLYCLNANNGDLIWKQNHGGGTASSPAVVNGRVYIGVNDGQIYCFDAVDGSLLWNSSIEGWTSSSPAVADGRVFIAGSSSLGFYCFNATNGALMWSWYAPDSIESSPAVADGKVYFTSNDGYIYCFDAVGNIDGSAKEIWNQSISNTAGGGLSSSPSVAYGNVYVGSNNGKLYCLDASNGNILYSYSTGDERISSSPAVANGTVYFGTSRNYGYDEAHVFCLNSDNLSLIWRFTTPYPNSQIFSSPAVADGKVVFGTGNRNITCLNADTGALIWNYHTSYAIRSSPAIANGKVYIGSTDKKLYCFGPNSPPTQPDMPQGQSEGYLAADYTYSTTAVTDPDGDAVSYIFDWGDGTTSGWISAPTSNHRWTSAGTYSVRVHAKDSLNATSLWSSGRIVKITNPPLVVTANPSLVPEETNFTITVMLNTQLLQGATVTFTNESVISNSDGVVTYTAPQVSHNTLYTITATYQDYSPATTTITVLDTTTKPTNGFIYGIVSDDTGSLVTGADVCAFPSIDPSTSYCTITDSQGRYVKAVPAGTYTVKAQYKDYIPAMQSGVVVQERTAVEVNLAFQSNNPSPTYNDETSNLVNKVISDAIGIGIVGAKLTVSGEDQSSRTISVESYQDAYTIDVRNTDDLASFTISAETGTPSTFVVLAIDRDFITPSGSLQVIYDGASVPQMSIQRFLTPETNTEVGYVLLSTSDGVYLAIYVPSFSAHTITISEVTTALSGLIALVFYVLVCGVVGVVVASPILMRFIRKIYFNKEK
jgi:eukaryotic-like serine/threonine-protein kinase